MTNVKKEVRFLVFFMPPLYTTVSIGETDLSLLCFLRCDQLDVPLGEHRAAGFGLMWLLKELNGFFF